MVHAYVMVKTAPGASAAVIADAKALPETSEAHIVAGDFDIVVEVDVEDVYSVLHLASSKLQSLEGVVDTRTYIALE